MGRAETVVPRTYVRCVTSAPVHPPCGELSVDVVWGPLRPAPPLPVGLLSREEKAAELARLQAEKAARAAYEAELIVGLAEDTPELPEDHPAAGRGSWSPDAELPGVDESFTFELSMVLGRSAYQKEVPGRAARRPCGSFLLSARSLGVRTRHRRRSRRRHYHRRRGLGRELVFPGRRSRPATP